MFVWGFFVWVLLFCLSVLNVLFVFLREELTG